MIRLRKKAFYSFGYAVILILFSVYVLLDTFVIPKPSREPTLTGEYAEAWQSSGAAAADAVLTERTYQDENISISITEHRVESTTVYVADVRLSSAVYLKAAFADDIFGKNQKDVTSAIAADHRAILAVNGDFCGYRPEGYVIRNGILYRRVMRQDFYEDLVIYADGSFATISEKERGAESLLKDGAVHVFSFGPTLVKGGEIAVSTTEEVARSKKENPRTAIGILEPLHYLIVVSDGRTKESEGLSLYELAGFLKEQGCSLAYNLDGGGSSTMVFHGAIVNYPTNGNKAGERRVSDIVYIGYE